MNEVNIYIHLAELFFLDVDPEDPEYRVAAKYLKELGWSKEKTKRELVTIISPIVAANLGYGIFPVIGEWSGFDRDWFYKRLSTVRKRRSRTWKGFYLIQDWWYWKLLKQLEVARLLDLL